MIPPSVPVDTLRTARLLPWLIAFVLAGASLYLGAMAWSGWHIVVQAFARLGGGVLLAGAVLACLSYLPRFWRWHLALHVLGEKVAAGFNLRVYLSGLALTTSPGKVGETLRSVLLAARGVAVRRSLACFLADRLADVLGVCLLGAVAGWLLGHVFNVAAAGLLLVALGGFGLRTVVRRPTLTQRWLARAPRRLHSSSRLAGGALDDWALLWQPARVLAFSLLGSLAYGMQSAVFAWFCARMGIVISPARAIEIFVNATLFGAASMVPGGLGTMEASLVLQLAEEGVPQADAISVAIATRVATLWTAIAVGLACLASLSGSRGKGGPA